MTVELPTALLRGLSASDVPAAREWWQALSEAARAEFVLLYDARTDNTHLYGVTDESGATTWHELPVHLRGRVIDQQDIRDRLEWKQTHLEYALNHPEYVVLIEGRTFHICRAHPVARAVIRAGIIPSAFSCPAGDDDCPLERMLGACPGRALLLS